MSGFPGRPARSHFGPTYRNAQPVYDPSKELGAQAINLLCWQVAGAGRTVPLAVLLIQGDGALLLQQLAFDPRGKLENVDVEKTGTGVYKVTFEAAYPNEGGVMATLTPRAALVAPQSGTGGFYGVANVAGSVITAYTYNASDAAADSKFLLQVW